VLLVSLRSGSSDVKVIRIGRTLSPLSRSAVVRRYSVLCKVEGYRVHIVSTVRYIIVPIESEYCTKYCI